MTTLDGMVALVTGGGRGIGRATAQALAAAGAQVAVASRSEVEVREVARAISAAGGVALAVPMDVTDRSAVDACVAKVTAELGDIDLLVNNAGSNRVVGPLWEIDPDEWWADVDVNLRGPFLCARAVLPAMVGRGRGRIVNIVSGTAGRAFPYDTAYASSKAALVRLTDSLAGETAGHGVSVFALGPGNVDTRMTKDLVSSDAAHRWMGDTLDNLAFIPAEVAASAVVFLAEGHADRLSGRWLVASEDLAGLAECAEQIVDGDLLQLRRALYDYPHKHLIGG
jgi:NAD(P)-dependent dehydrogenase (short-subunit alcohol dehydrogenase family)